MRKNISIARSRAWRRDSTTNPIEKNPLHYSLRVYETNTTPQIVGNLLTRGGISPRWVEIFHLHKTTLVWWGRFVYPLTAIGSFALISRKQGFAPSHFTALGLSGEVKISCELWLNCSSPVSPGSRRWVVTTSSIYPPIPPAASAF